MLIKRKFRALAALLAVFVFSTPAMAASLNKSINLGDNSENDGQSSVNGSITVGDNSIVNGSLSTVNGTVRVGENTRLKDAETVNGSIRIGTGSIVDDVESVNGTVRIGEQVTVGGQVEVVNGKISLDKGSTVADGVGNVNGEISIAGAEIGGNISTVNGDVTLSDEAILRGDLLVEKPGWGNRGNKRKPKIIIGPGSEVVGTIVLEREVDLFVSESAKVGGVSGVMTMDDAVRFSGENP